MYTKKIIDVNTGDVKGTKEGLILRSIAIGSCIAVVAYNSFHRAGVIAHVMLPGKSGNASRKTRYAVDAIEKLISIMEEFGIKKEQIEVCLVGAGNVLEKEDDTICRPNIDSVTQILKDEDILINASVLGGIKRKSVSLDVASGTVSYTEGEGKETVLWQW